MRSTGIPLGISLIFVLVIIRFTATGILEARNHTTASILLSATATPTALSAPPYASPVAWPSIYTRPAFNGFTTETLISSLVPPTDGSDRVFITELSGKIHVIMRKNGEWLPATLFLDIRDRVNFGGEFGLYSIAFPTNYASNDHFYVKYVNHDANVVISRFRLSATNPNEADPNSEEIVLIVDQPPYPNHKGGTLEFGPDGMLYIGMGDGGFPYEQPNAVGDPHNYAQDPSTLLGKMVRIDVETNSPLTYTIPIDNPFVNTDGYRPEIWLTGLRNPWLFSFDTLNGDLYIGDVGHSMWEEINVLPASSTGGENLGWSCYEGEHIYKNCPNGNYRRPDWVYRHTDVNCGVAGGYVYRGNAQFRMKGLYFYGDLCTGKLYAMRQYDGLWQSNEVGKSTNLFIILGSDQHGEIYVASTFVEQLVDRGIEPMVSPTPTPDISATPSATLITSFTPTTTATATVSPTDTPIPLSTPLRPLLYLPLIRK